MRRFVAIIAAALIGSIATGAAAQISNKPYAFPGGGGPGMSQAGKQAIILNAVDPSISPTALMRSPSGELLVPVPIPRGNNKVPALVAPFSGQVHVPPYFRDFWGGLGYGAGVFNPFFAGSSGTRFFYTNPDSDSISIWTSRVFGTGGFGATSNAIDDWTAAAYALQRAR